jgi:hypothetical protein
VKQTKVFIKKEIRIEGTGLTPNDAAEVCKYLFGSQSQVISMDNQTGHTLVTVWDYHSSHNIEAGGRS